MWISNVNYKYLIYSLLDLLTISNMWTKNKLGALWVYGVYFVQKGKTVKYFLYLVAFTHWLQYYYYSYIVTEAARQNIEMANSYPYTWEPLSAEDDATVKRCFGDLGTAQELVRSLKMFSFKCSSPSMWCHRSKPELMTMRANPSFKDHCDKVRNIKVKFEISYLLAVEYFDQVRPDDVWVVTHPKCGTTWTQVFVNISEFYSIIK